MYRELSDVINLFCVVDNCKVSLLYAFYHFLCMFRGIYNISIEFSGMATQETQCSGHTSYLTRLLMRVTVAVSVPSSPNVASAHANEGKEGQPMLGSELRAACLLLLVRMVEAMWENIQDVEGGLRTSRRFPYDRCLLTRLFDRWRPKTYMFYLPCEEMAPTLQDMGFLIGLLCRDYDFDEEWALRREGGGPLHDESTPSQVSIGASQLHGAFVASETTQPLLVTPVQATCTGRVQYHRKSHHRRFRTFITDGFSTFFVFMSVITGDYHRRFLNRLWSHNTNGFWLKLSVICVISQTVLFTNRLW